MRGDADGSGRIDPVADIGERIRGQIDGDLLVPHRDRARGRRPQAQQGADGLAVVEELGAAGAVGKRILDVDFAGSKTEGLQNIGGTGIFDVEPFPTHLLGGQNQAVVAGIDREDLGRHARVSNIDGVLDLEQSVLGLDLDPLAIDDELPTQAEGFGQGGKRARGETAGLGQLHHFHTEGAGRSLVRDVYRYPVVIFRPGVDNRKEIVHIELLHTALEGEQAGVDRLNNLFLLFQAGLSTLDELDRPSLDADELTDDGVCIQPGSQTRKADSLGHATLSRGHVRSWGRTALSWGHTVLS